MLVTEAQREVRTVFAGGFFGQLVSGAIWLVAAAFGTWHSRHAAIAVLILGGFFIFPITTGILALLGRPRSLSSSNPFRHLAVQVAFVLPLSIPLVVPVTSLQPSWFFPAMMVLVGAHYLPFATLYGMRSFIPLSALLVTAGIAVALVGHESFSAGGWIGALLLVVFAFIGRLEAERSAA